MQPSPPPPPPPPPPIPRAGYIFSYLTHLKNSNARIGGHLFYTNVCACGALTP